MGSVDLFANLQGVVIAAYAIICLYFGFLGAGKITNLKEFALGYKNISTGILVATIYATHLGAGATLGLIEQINNIGIVAAVINLGGVCRWYITKEVFCKNVARFSGCERIDATSTRQGKEQSLCVERAVGQHVSGHLYILHCF